LVAVGAIVGVVGAAACGLSAYPLLLMVKSLPLAQWYELSDEQLRQALWDRISFRRSVGLGLDEDAPHRSTVSRFGLQLAWRGLAQRLFAELNRQLEARGLVLRHCAPLNASPVAALVHRTRRRTRAGVRSERDPEAS